MLYAQPSNELGKPFLQRWLPKDYGAHHQNWAIAQDDRGVMYFGNNDGVLEFDGVSWQLHRFGNISFTRSLAASPDGKLYVGGKGEFGYFEPVSVAVQDNKASRVIKRKFVSLLEYLDPQNRDFTDVQRIVFSSQGVFFLTNKYLFRYTVSPGISQSVTADSSVRKGRMYVWTSETSFRSNGLAAVDDRVFVVQRGKGLMQVIGDSLVSVPGGEEIFYPFSIVAPFSDREGHRKTLIATMDGSFFQYDGIQCEPLETEADLLLKESGISYGHFMPNGILIIAKNNGSFIIMDLADRGRVLQVVDQALGLPESFVNDALYDRQGGFWIALNNGIARVEAPAPLTFFDEMNGISGIITAIARHQNTMYVTNQSGVRYLSPSEPSTFKPVLGVEGWGWALLVVPAAGALLAGSENGLYQIRGDRAELLMDFGYDIVSLHQSRRDPNHIFMGLRYGGLAMAHYVPGLHGRAGTWVNDGKIAGIEEYVIDIAETAEGSLWLTAKYEPYLIRVSFSQTSAAATSSNWSKPEIQRFGVAHGLPQAEWINTVTIAGQLYAHPRGSILRFNAQRGRFIPDSTIHARADTSKIIEKMIEDQEGNVWFDFDGTMHLARHRPDGGYDTDVVPFLRIDRQAFNASYPDENGVAWFGGIDVLFRYDSRVRKDYAVDFPALIRRVIAAEDSVLFDGLPLVGADTMPRLPYMQNRLRFEFAAPSYDNLSANRYQVLLEGFDQSWSAWSAETRKDYTNLPEGDYRFRVRARNGYDHLSQEAVFAFTILPPWWRTWWAYTLYGLLLGGAVFATDRVQRRRLLRKERERAYLHEKELRAEAAEYLANYLQAENQRQTAENQRQTQELEQARQLQLSMLPRTMPTHPAVELAAYMKTATEVGGDYYDADLSEDGTLTLVIGDATGHGLPAGTMVTATKGILGALARQDDLGQVLQTASEAVRRMRLPRLYMALALVRLRGQVLEVAGAGMPPAMVYRAATGSIDVVPLKGMPLGSPGRYPYRVQQVVLSSGDTVLLMSDGLPELRGVTGELLGYERMPGLMAEMGGRGAEELIACVLEAATTWCDGTAPDDDLTLIVMRMKTTPANGHRDLLTSENDPDA